MISFNPIIDTVLSALVYILATSVLFYIGKIAYKLINRKIDISDELVIKDNFAFALAQIGYYAGLLLSIGGAVIGESKGIVTDLIEITVYGLLGVLLLNLSIFINRKLILRKFCVYKEIIDDQNAGTGLVVGASAFATGMLILGAVYGDGGGIDTALVFWIIGQVALVLTAFVYELILPYDVHKEIEKDNVAVGIGFAGALIAIANLIRNAIMHDFESWSESFIMIAVQVAIGLLLLPVVRYLTDKILLPGSDLTHEIVRQDKPNHGAALIEAFAYIGGSIIITWCI